MTTKAIWPWVRTEAFGRPVVPEVKKNQHGSSRSTGTSAGACPACSATRASHEGPKPASPIATVKGSAQAAAWSGKAALQIMPVAPEAFAR